MNKVKKIPVMRYIAIALIILGVLALSVDIVDKLQSKELNEKGVKTTAIVKTCKNADQSGRGDWIYPAIVSYVDLNNIEYENEIHTHYIIQEGDIIDIYYNTNNPDIVSAEPYIDYVESGFWLEIVIIIIGILLLIKSVYKKADIETEKKRRTIVNFVVVGFIIAGTFGFANSYYLQDKVLKDFSENAIQTIAVIDSVYKDYHYVDADGAFVQSQPTDYRLSLRYTTLDGKEYRSTGRTYTEYKSGDSISIYYDKDFPYKVRVSLEQYDIKKKYDTYMGFVCIGIACFIFIYNNRKRKKVN